MLKFYVNFLALKARTVNYEEIRVSGTIYNENGIIYETRNCLLIYTYMYTSKFVYIMYHMQIHVCTCV